MSLFYCVSTHTDVGILQYFWCVLNLKIIYFIHIIQNLYFYVYVCVNIYTHQRKVYIFHNI